MFGEIKWKGQEAFEKLLTSNKQNYTLGFAWNSRETDLDF